MSWAHRLIRRLWPKPREQRPMAQESAYFALVPLTDSRLSPARTRAILAVLGGIALIFMVATFLLVPRGVSVGNIQASDDTHTPLRRTDEARFRTPWRETFMPVYTSQCPHPLNNVLPLRCALLVRSPSLAGHATHESCRHHVPASFYPSMQCTLPEEMNRERSMDATGGQRR